MVAKVLAFPHPIPFHFPPILFQDRARIEVQGLVEGARHAPAHVPKVCMGRGVQGLAECPRCVWRVGGQGVYGGMGVFCHAPARMHGVIEEGTGCVRGEANAHSPKSVTGGEVPFRKVYLGR